LTTAPRQWLAAGRSERDAPFDRGCAHEREQGLVGRGLIVLRLLGARQTSATLEIAHDATVQDRGDVRDVLIADVGRGLEAGRGEQTLAGVDAVEDQRVEGDKITHDRLANGVNATIVFVDYVNSPDAKHPTQNEQAYAAMQYAVEHAKELRVDASRLAIVGDSAGGAMAAGLTLMAKQRKGLKIAAQVLFYPVTDYIKDRGSNKEFADGPWLNAKTMKWMFDLQGLDGNTKDITAFPLRATIEDLKGLPDALIIVDDDILRDEGEAYARKLASAGVRVTSVRYDDTVHDFVMLNPLAETPAARSAIALVVGALTTALHP